MYEDLAGRVAVVTGGARGIGAAICAALAGQGAHVAVLDLLDQTEQAAAELGQRYGVPTMAVRADVTDAEALQQAVAQVEQDLGTPRVLVTAAGISGDADALEVTPELWRRVVDVNLTGTFLSTQAFARSVVAARSSGAVVHVASMSARIVNIPQRQSAYNASKAGVEALSRSLAVEWVDQGIRVNAVSPGYILSDMTRASVERDPQRAAFWRDRIPAGDMGTPQHVAAAVVFLASQASAYIVGQSIVIDGGYTAI